MFCTKCYVTFYTNGRCSILLQPFKLIVLLPSPIIEILIRHEIFMYLQTITNRTPSGRQGCKYYKMKNEAPNTSSSRPQLQWKTFSLLHKIGRFQHYDPKLNLDMYVSKKIRRLIKKSPYKFHNKSIIW